MSRTSFTKAKIILVSLILCFLLPFIAYAFDEAKVYPLGEALIEAINNSAQKGIRPSDAQLLLLTADLKWYEQNMSRLPLDIQNKVQNLRLKLAKRSVEISAMRIGDTTAMFGATGSWNPGRDMDVIYFGKKTEQAKQALISSLEIAMNEMLDDGLMNDEVLKSIKSRGIRIPQKIAAETMSFGMLELPDFGYGRLGDAFRNAIESKKMGVPLDSITEGIKREFAEAMISNFEAHIATTASGDFYRGATGQEWFKENYLKNPEKMRLFEFEIDATGSKLNLKRGGASAVPEAVMKRTGITDFFMKPLEIEQQRFSKVASDMAMYWDHQKGGLSDTAKYYQRIWDDIDTNTIYNKNWNETLEEIRFAAIAKKIKERPDRLQEILKEAGITASEYSRRIEQSMMKWTERQLMKETRMLVDELTLMRFSPRPDEEIKQLELLMKSGKMKMDAMEIVSGLERIKKANPKFLDTLLNRMTSQFNNTEAGRIIIKYIKIQLKLLADEGGEVAKRLLKILLKSNKITEAEYEKALRSKSIEEMPASVRPKIKRAKAEVMMIASANMTSLDDSEESLDLLFSIWQKKYPQAMIQGKSPELLEFIQEIGDMDERQLQRVGWQEPEIRLPRDVKKRLPYDKQNMKLLGYKLSEKMTKNGLSLRQLQERIYELLFSEAYTRFGDPNAAIGAMDTFMGVISGLVQSYDILFNERYPNEADENLALANAWITAIPLVGDVAQGIITGIEGGFEGDKLKIAEGGLWIGIGMLGFIPGGQLPAVVAALTLGLKPIAVASYSAYDAQNLIQAWIESGLWSDDKPARLVALYDRNKLKHDISYEHLLTKKWSEVPYLSKRYGNVTIGDSIRSYADKYIAPQYPGLTSLRDALKQLYPDFNDKDWEDQFTANYKIDARGGKAGKMVFKAYEKIRTKIYQDTLAHLKQWAEDERRAAKDYDSEVARLRQRIRELEVILKVSNLLRNAEASVEAYSRIIVNKFEQESLPLSKIRIYENYVRIYEDIERKLNRVKAIINEASADSIPDRWHLTGFPEFDSERISRLLRIIENARAGIIREIEGILRDSGYEKSIFDINDKCHKRAFEILAALRYKIAFADNLAGYYRDLINQSSGWADAFELAKDRYIKARSLYDSFVNPLTTEQQLSTGTAPFFDALIAFITALPYTLAQKDIPIYKEAEQRIELLKQGYMRELELLKGASGRIARELRECMAGAVKVKIKIDGTEFKRGTEVLAEAVVIKGAVTKDMVWDWKLIGKLKKLKAQGSKLDFVVLGDGQIVLTLYEWFNPNTGKYGKVVDTDTVSIKALDDPSPCEYKYTPWSECNKQTRKQTRKVISKTPKDCVEKDKPVLEQTCEVKEAIPCTYEYSDWGACSDTTRRQTRTVTAKRPLGCIEKDKPVLEKMCAHYSIAGLPKDVIYGTSHKLDIDGDIGELLKGEPKKVIQAIDKSTKKQFDPKIQNDGTQKKKVLVKKRQSVRGRCPDDDLDLIPELVGKECHYYRMEEGSQIKSPEEPEKPVPSAPDRPSLRVVWHSTPNITFNPIDSKGPTTATFDSMGYNGKVKIWAQIFQKDGEKPVETPMREVTISPPKFNVRFSPDSGTVGKETKANVTTTPDIPAELIRYVWLSPSRSDVKPYTGNESIIGFVPKDDKSITFHASARSKRDEIVSDNIRATYSAKQYQVSIGEPKYSGPPIQIWQCDTQFGQAQRCGMVQLKPNQFVTHTDIYLSSTITPQAESPKYRWSIDPAGSCGFPGAGSEIKVNCSNVGTYTIRLEVTNAEGIKLGEATRALSITVTQEQVNNSKKSKDAYEKVQRAKELMSQGKIDEAVSIIKAASQLDKTAAQPVISQISSEAKKAGWNALNKGDYKSAIKRLEQAVELNPSDPEAQRKLEDARDYQANMPWVEANVREFEQLVAEKKTFSAHKKMLEIQDILKKMSGGQSGSNPLWMKVYEDYNKLNAWYNELIKKTNAEWQRLYKEKNWDAAEKLLTEVLKYELHDGTRNNYETALQTVRMQKGLQAQCEEKWTEGKTLYDAKRYDEALEKFKENLACAPNNRERQQYVSKLRQSLGQKQAQRQACMNIRRQGDSLVQQNRLEEAIVQYKNHLKCNPDDKLEEYIKTLEDRLNQEKEQRQRAELEKKAEKLIQEAYQLQVRGDLRGAIDKYMRAQEIVFDSAIDYRISRLQEELQHKKERKIKDAAEAEERKKRIELAKRLREEGARLQRAKKIPEAIEKYRESLEYVPDNKLEEHIRKLELAMTRPTPTPSPTVSPQTTANYTGSWRARCENLSEQYTVDIKHSGDSFSANSSYGIYTGTISGNQIRGRSSDGDSIVGSILSSNTIKITIHYVNIGASACELIRVGGYSTDNNRGQNQQGSSQHTSTITAEFINRARENIHIFAEGYDTFGPHNRVTPNERKRVNINLQSSAGTLKFVAGRNRQVISTCSWSYNSDTIARKITPRVTFNPSSSLSCVSSTSGAASDVIMSPRDPITGDWSSNWGTVTFKSGNPITGSWNQGGSKIGQFTEGTYDPTTRILRIYYYQPWNNARGWQKFRLSEDGKRLEGKPDHEGGWDWICTR